MALGGSFRTPKAMQSPFTLSRAAGYPPARPRPATERRAGLRMAATGLCTAFGGTLRLWLLPFLLVLSVSLAPAAHRPAPEVPAWLTADLCGEGPAKAVLTACPFCLLQAAFHLAPGGGPLLALPAPRLTAILFPPGPARPVPGDPRHQRPPVRGPPARA